MFAEARDAFKTVHVKRVEGRPETRLEIEAELQPHIGALGTALVLTRQTTEKESILVTGRSAWDITYRLATELVVNEVSREHGQRLPRPVSTHALKQCYHVLDHILTAYENAAEIRRKKAAEPDTFTPTRTFVNWKPID